MKKSRDLRRLAAWGLVALAGASALTAWLALRASSDLALGRERLLAGDTASADAAFARARRWPGASAAARAGRAVSAARAGRATAEAVSLADLDALAPEALVLSAVAEGRLDAAGALADLARRAGHPLGDLYAAALAFERGDEAEARALAATSPVPLASRGLGSRLVRALEARDAGARKLLFDRNGALVAIVGREGGIETDPDAAPLLTGVLERLPALPDGDAARLSIDLGLSRVALEALGEHRGSIVLVEPRTGAVLAAVSDERTAAAEGAAAFTQRREPASIAKLLTSAAAYRAGVDADVEIKRMTCGGVERYGGKPLWCTFAAGPARGPRPRPRPELQRRLREPRHAPRRRAHGGGVPPLGLRRRRATRSSARRAASTRRRARRGSWPTSRWASSSPTSRRSTRPSSPPSWRTTGGCRSRAW